MGPIVLVGGGIGGMTTALALSSRHIPSIVLEQASEFRESGAGIMLCPNAIKVFAHLGVDKQIIDLAFFPENLVYADGLNGMEFIRLPMGKEIIKRFNHPYVSVHREEFLKILVQECRKSPLIHLVTSAQVVEVKEDKQVVSAITKDKKVYEGAALVGCDGLWSSVRKFILDDQKPILSGTVTHRGVISKDKLPRHLHTSDLIHWDRPGGHLVLYQIGTKGLVNLVAVYQADDPIRAEGCEGDPEELHRKFAGSIPTVLELLQFIDTSKKWMMYDRNPTRSWSKGKMTLLGDAAHPTLPHLTQGAAMAIEDAVVLAKKIDENNEDYQKAFEDYQQARYLRTAYVQLFSRAYADVHHADGIARELKLSLLSKRTNEENYHWLKEIYNGIDL
jgi:3-hydroxybenzoate 6-monooxygenase